jgi:DNA-binding MarR family transcriptional regulator
MEAAAAPKPRAAPSTGAAALAAELRVALMRAARRLRAEKSDADLSDSQYSVLAMLEREGPRTPREIAVHERVQPPSMTRTLTALLELGLVTRTEHPSDRRQVLIAITEPGARTVRETRRRRDAWLARRLAALPPHEREVLARATQILRRIADS